MMTLIVDPDDYDHEQAVENYRNGYRDRMTRIATVFRKSLQFSRR